MYKFTRFLIHPCGAVFLSVFLSLFAWIIPSLTGVNKGYNETIQFLGSTWIIVFFWYSIVLGSAAGGYYFGLTLFASSNKRFLNEGGIFSGRYLWFLTISGSIGVSAAYLVIVRQIGFAGILDAMRDSQANQLKEALYDEYSIGLLSLRYITILSSGVSLAEFWVNRKIRIVHILAGVGLFLTATISSRMSFVWAIAIGLGLYYMYPDAKRPLRLFTLMFGGALAFGMLTLFNFIRNSGTYETMGVDNPILANIAEMHRYLAAPFQGGLAAAQYMQEFATGGDPWMLSGIDPSLTTNSALFSMIPQFGYAAFGVIAFFSFFGGMLMGLTRSRPGSIVSAGYFVIWYCFAELWRGNLFFAGITITLLSFTFGAAFFAGGFFRAKIPLSLPVYPSKILRNNHLVAPRSNHR